MAPPRPRAPRASAPRLSAPRLFRLRSLSCAPRRSLARDERGVSAIEFAMIAPVMIVMFFGMGELGQGLIAGRRVTHANAALGDLVAQKSSVATSDLNDCFQAAFDVMKPLATTTLKMRVSSVTGDTNGNPKVDWSSGYGLTPYTKGAAPPVTLPQGLIVNAGDTIVLSETTYSYTSALSYILPNGLSFARSAYLRPRKGSVACTTC